MKDKHGTTLSSRAADGQLSWLFGQDNVLPTVNHKPKMRLIVILAVCLVLLAGLVCLLSGLHDPENGNQEQAARALAVRAMLDAPFAPGSLRNLTAEEARNWNSNAPASVDAPPAATAFVINPRSAADMMRSVDCLTAAVYYEAGQEPITGRRAVAQVILNRVRHPAFPATVCGVVFQGAGRATGCQFTFTCDGSLKRVPSAAGWAQARAVAEQALSGSIFAPVGWATHYHADYVVPYWAPSLAKIGQIGAHIFYTWKGANGAPASFWQRYAGNEPVNMPLAAQYAAETASVVGSAQRRPELVLVEDKERPVISGDPERTQVRSDAGKEFSSQHVSETDRWVIQSPVLP